MITPELGRIMMGAGALLFFVGLFFVFRDKLPGGIGLLGKLPGDIAVEKENFKFYFPLTTSILLSVVLSVLFWLFRK